MEDSPLSITANITGILTFMAAIMAFIYIRFNTLRNGVAEVTNILISVTSSLEDTRLMRTTNPGEYLQKLINELFEVEMHILHEATKVISPSGPWQTANEGAILHGLGLVHLRILQRYTKLSNVLGSFPTLLWAGVTFVLTLGQTPKLIRWYLVRDDVLKMILQRETLRSRMIFYQMSLVHT